MTIDNDLQNTDFDNFIKRYSNILLEKFPHLCNFHIHFVSNLTYMGLKTVPVIDSRSDSPFCYSIKPREEVDSKNEAWIIYNSNISNHLELNKGEIFSSIAHEFGHIVNFNNTKLINASISFQEIFADELPILLGLGNELKSSLLKLKQIETLHEDNKSLIDTRVSIINRYL